MSNTLSSYTFIKHKVSEGRSKVGLYYDKQNNMVAIKSIPISGFVQLQEIMKRIKETFFTTKLEHTNIICPNNVFYDTKYCYMVMKYIDYDLDSVIKNFYKSFQDQEKIAVFLQIVQALEYCHKKNIVHYDLRPTKILMANQDNAWIPYITNFGSVKDTKTTVRNGCYVSPEIMQNMDVTSKSDIYSLGLILYEMFTGSSPFNGNAQNIEKQMEAEHFPEIEGQPKITALINQMLKFDPNKRISATEILRNPLFSSLITNSRQTKEKVVTAAQLNCELCLGLYDSPAERRTSNSYCKQCIRKSIEFITDLKIQQALCPNIDLNQIVEEYKPYLNNQFVLQYLNSQNSPLEMKNYLINLRTIKFQNKQAFYCNFSLDNNFYFHTNDSWKEKGNMYHEAHLVLGTINYGIFAFTFKQDIYTTIAFNHIINNQIQNGMFINNEDEFGTTIFQNNELREYTAFYKGGQRRCIYQCANGMLHGSFQRFQENGRTIEQGTFTNNKKDESIQNSNIYR
ncbi:Kinase [Hexamita inflata]|uniref:Kinase n=1 Tax=Hexamita inflata TaxID=28002 RepID=A0AA86U7D1_9EUKA|nr:Kinase [Hexamita inflata]